MIKESQSISPIFDRDEKSILKRHTNFNELSDEEMQKAIAHNLGELVKTGMTIANNLSVIIQLLGSINNIMVKKSKGIVIPEVDLKKGN